MENQALAPRQSNFPAVHLFSAFGFFLFVVCALFCIACRSPALSLSFIGRRRADPRKACHLVKFQGKTVLDVWPKIFTFQAVDTLPEWSKGGGLKFHYCKLRGFKYPRCHMAPLQLSHPHKKQSVAAAGILSPTETLSPGRAVRGLSLTVQTD